MLANLPVPYQLCNAHLAWCLNSDVLDVRSLVCAFNPVKALVGAFSVIVNLHLDLRFKLYCALVQCSVGDVLTLTLVHLMPAGVT